ncbi:MAG: Isoprenyl transferase [Eubacteriales bacterium SKADARSKE-1]|nr:Isoprenyl transferase [Eubacteriales bacterium SKADARSKE-1]
MLYVVVSIGCDKVAFWKKQKTQKNKVLPVHIGIIMDGNGRWAKKRGLPRSAGHKAGADNFRKIAKYCSKIGIKYLTVYAFSTENWRRPSDEVDFLMRLFKQYLEESLRDFKEENIRVIFIGDRNAFSEDLQTRINEVEASSKICTGMVLNIAMNYGGRSEILKAVKSISEDVKESKLSIEDITEQTLSDKMYTYNQPDPDLIIRPSGEFRTSNFLIWQSAYSEYLFLDTLWPDFKPVDLEKALDKYALRNRRFGGI